MGPPSVVIKDGMGGRRFARSFSRCAATERLVNAVFVVVDSELFQLPLQVDRVPDHHVIKKLSSNRPNQPFNVSVEPFKNIGRAICQGHLVVARPPAVRAKVTQQNKRQSDSRGRA